MDWAFRIDPLSVVVMLVVLVSTAYPARQASRQAVPDVVRRWQLPDPQGDVWRFQFPFTVNRNAIEIFNEALRAVDPRAAVARHGQRIRAIRRDEGLKDIVVVGFGKAACPMTRALLDELGESVRGGVVVTKYGHCEGGLPAGPIELVEAGHPVPDENSVAGAGKAVGLIGQAGRESLVVCLISGGGSALFVSPMEGLSLDDKQEMTRILLRGGADIMELNTVRKHLSRVKAGRLAEAAWPARVVSLILSDVIGDPVDFIASGPTAPDGTTFDDAAEVIGKYGLWERLPEVAGVENAETLTGFTRLTAVISGAACGLVASREMRIADGSRSFP